MREIFARMKSYLIALAINFFYLALISAQLMKHFIGRLEQKEYS